LSTGFAKVTSTIDPSIIWPEKMNVNMFKLVSEDNKKLTINVAV
jgi:hypothetical protein